MICYDHHHSSTLRNSEKGALEGDLTFDKNFDYHFYSDSAPRNSEKGALEGAQALIECQDHKSYKKSQTPQVSEKGNYEVNPSYNSLNHIGTSISRNSEKGALEGTQTIIKCHDHHYYSKICNECNKSINCCIKPVDPKDSEKGAPKGGTHSCPPHRKKGLGKRTQNYTYPPHIH